MKRRRIILVGALALVVLIVGIGLAWRCLRVPEPKPGTVRVCPMDGKEMVYVPSGAFLMGSPEGKGEPEERPQHWVYLDGFWIDKTAVTVAEYRKFCQSTGRAVPPVATWAKLDTCPIMNVAWEEAAAYAAWAGKQLPTEAQWEKAARGTDGRQYPWGNEWDTSKSASGASLTNPNEMQPVGTYPAGASPYGALDMAGGIDEWCAEWWDDRYYRSAPYRNPPGPASGRCRVSRGVLGVLATRRPSAPPSGIPGPQIRSRTPSALRVSGVCIGTNELIPSHGSAETCSAVA